MRYFILPIMLLLMGCDAATTSPAAIQPTLPLPATFAIQKNCIACHNATGNMVGPAWHNIANKYKNDAGATVRLTDKVLNGGSGSFGAVVMPPQATKLTPEEAHYMVEWILKGAPN